MPVEFTWCDPISYRVTANGVLVASMDIDPRLGESVWRRPGFDGKKLVYHRPALITGKRSKFRRLPIARPLTNHRGDRVTVDDLIDHYANALGGVHYNPRRRKKENQLLLRALVTDDGNETVRACLGSLARMRVAALDAELFMRLSPSTIGGLDYREAQRLVQERSAAESVRLMIPPGLDRVRSELRQADGPARLRRCAPGDRILVDVSDACEFCPDCEPASPTSSRIGRARNAAATDGTRPFSRLPPRSLALGLSPQE